MSRPPPDARDCESDSLRLAMGFLGQTVRVVVDRPIGSKHPEYDFVYEPNYGYVPGTRAPDGEGLDVYLLGWDAPVEVAEGICIAIIHRPHDDDDKLVVVPLEAGDIADPEILRAVHFLEQWFEHMIVRYER